MLSNAKVRQLRISAGSKKIIISSSNNIYYIQIHHFTQQTMLNQTLYYMIQYFEPNTKSRGSGNHPPVSTGILPHSLPEWAFRARPGLWQICLCPKVARIAEHKFGCR